MSVGLATTRTGLAPPNGIHQTPPVEPLLLLVPLAQKPLVPSCEAAPRMLSPLKIVVLGTCVVVSTTAGLAPLMRPKMRGTAWPVGLVVAA